MHSHIVGVHTHIVSDVVHMNGIVMRLMVGSHSILVHHLMKMCGTVKRGGKAKASVGVAGAGGLALALLFSSDNTDYGRDDVEKEISPNKCDKQRNDNKHNFHKFLPLSFLFTPYYSATVLPFLGF